MKLCPYHQDSFGWDACTDGWEDCSIEIARELLFALKVSRQYLVKAEIDGMKTALPVSQIIKMADTAIAKVEGGCHGTHERTIKGNRTGGGSKVR